MSYLAFWFFGGRSYPRAVRPSRRSEFTSQEIDRSFFTFKSSRASRIPGSGLNGIAFLYAMFIPYNIKNKSSILVNYLLTWSINRYILSIVKIDGPS